MSEKRYNASTAILASFWMISLGALIVLVSKSRK